MEIIVHKFPTLNEGLIKVEETFCDMLNKYRNGETLDTEELDWFDWANNVLSTSDQ